MAERRLPGFRVRWKPTARSATSPLFDDKRTVGLLSGGQDCITASVSFVPGVAGLVTPTLACFATCWFRRTRVEAIQPWTRNPEWACQRPLCLLEELLIVVAIKKRAKCLDSAQIILDSS